MTNDTHLNAAIAAVNSPNILVQNCCYKAIGVNFMTPTYLGTWKVRKTPYAIEVSTGKYPDGDAMYGLTAFVCTTRETLSDISEPSDTEGLQESLQSVISNLLALHQRTKEGMPNAE